MILMSLVIPLVASKVRSDTPADRKDTKVDVVGAALLTMAMILFAGGLSMLENYAFTDLVVWLPTVLGIAMALVLA